MRSLYEFAVPGVKESEAFGHLIGQSLARGGEYPETRLLACGPRTNPWFQESSDRVMCSGELLSFDTDLIGPMGFYNDISRSWVIGERRPTRAQATLLDISRAQLTHNIDLLRPGMSFVELASKAYRLPDAYLANRYADLVHGCGLGCRIPVRPLSRGCGRRDVRRPLRGEHDRVRGELRGGTRRTGRA